MSDNDGRCAAPGCVMRAAAPGGYCARHEHEAKTSGQVTPIVSSADHGGTTPPNPARDAARQATARADEAAARAAASKDLLARLDSTDRGVRAQAKREAAALFEAPQPDSAQIVCPHCQVRGKVTTKRVKRAKGVSGGKAAGAVVTAGFSLWATGLSRKERATEMLCGNCGTRWDVAAG